MGRRRDAPARPRRRTIELLVILAALGCWPHGTPAGAAELAARLGAALDHPGLRGASVGALVVHAGDGQVVFERGADQLLIPASNLKILTAVAALSLFGPSHRFTTRLYADAAPDQSGSVAMLAVRGGGDPALTSEEWWRLAADLRQRGVRHVRGDLILDDAYFDQQRWNPTWDGVSARAFHAPVGALNANYGAFSVVVRPARGAGARPTILVDPPVPYFEIVDRLQPGGAPLEVAREAAGARDRVVVSGAPPSHADSEPIERSVSDPARYAAAVLRLQLAAAGIVIDGQDRVGPVPPNFVEIMSFEGKPLADTVRLLMKFSNNNIAETLVKDMGAAKSGAPGSWPTGVAAIREQLATLGIDPSGLQTVDGSGLSQADRVTPRTFVSALRIAQASFAFGPELVSALPIAGRDGTLAHRAAAAADAVRAKTGLLRGAAGLSGYARSRDGTPLVFSILVNGLTRGEADAIAALDAFAAALVQ